MGKKVVIIGAGGHSRTVCDILLENRSVEIIGLVDDIAEHGFYGLKLLGKTSYIEKIFCDGQCDYAFVSIGANDDRYKLTEYVKKIGFKMLNVISPNAIISKNASIGTGNVIMPGAVINAGVLIGNNTIINTRSSIDHGSIVQDYVHIAPGCTICGNVTVKRGSFIGAASTVINNIEIGENVMIGAGAVVIDNISDNKTAFGVPAKVMKKKVLFFNSRRSA